MSVDEEFDPFKLETGLPSDYVGKVEDAYFGTKADYNDGQDLLLLMEVQTEDLEIGDGGKTTIQYTCGKDWEAYEKGAKARREDGKNKGFNENSGVGQLVKAAIQCGAGDVLRKRGGVDGPRDAGIWKGLTFRFERKEFSAEIDGEKRTWARMLPTEFKGEGGSVSTTSSTSTTSGVATAVVAAPSNGAAAASVVSLDPALKAKLIARARKAESHDQFIELAYSEIPELSGNTAAEDAVMDVNGIYAEANA